MTKMIDPALRDRTRYTHSLQNYPGQLIEAALGLPGRLEKLCGIRGVEVDQFGFEFGVEEDRFSRGDQLGQRGILRGRRDRPRTRE